MHKFLDFLRSRKWFKSTVTSAVARRLLAIAPQTVAFQLLKRLGPVEVRIRLAGTKFWIVTSSEDDHYMEALLRGMRSWESESLQTWAAICSRGGTVVDVGAYGGVYTALAISSGADRVIAYEPNPAMFDLLQSTVDKNHFGDRVILRNIALSDKAGEEVLMVLDSRPSTSGAHLASAVSDPNYEWRRGPLVVSATLDGDLAGLKVEQLSAMKIDVEGLESKVLTGGMQTILNNHPVLIVESLTPEALAATVEVASELGYERLVSTGPRVGVVGEFLPGNFMLT